MARGLNKEWELFGRKYRVAGAKVEKVDCKACSKQVSAAVNRLQSHLRVCPARATALPTTSNTTATSISSANAPQPPTDSLSAVIEHAIETDALAAEQATESSAPPHKKQRQSPARTRDRPRWNSSAAASISVDDFWLNPIAAGAASPLQSQSSLNKRRLEIEEKRLALEIKREQREQARERLHLDILAAQAKREKLLAEKEGYEAKVLLALSRKQLRDQGVSEDEIDRVLPTTTSSSAATETAADSPESVLT
ncbi:Nucleolar protein 12 [Phytophthora cinnamomi]|uniref:Nucleolar protein 12 n=1 Tax=Phytophthora cinnamomi TaxID=4785 RepID=UPI00355A4241|nr:Nucleolar protein 12 [Phytophthora cinnamomi]